ncbi:MAG: 16S rRNA (adenine(1518)-N(6)/adenine(1519)-N(6))-dimethyltransferase RsmA [Lysobacteraceae bacterium]
MSLAAHRTKKALGQHFLHDRQVVERILRAIDPRPGQRIVEIGPGAGALTFPLLQRHGELTAIEFDRDLIAPLTEAAARHGALHIIHADALSVDFTALAAGTPLRVVGNLPYNISSPILFHLLDHADAIADMHFMLQKEVVDRMAAAPGSKVYGRLSVMLQAACEVQALFDVPPAAFRPPPKVDSAVVRLRPRGDPGIADAVLFAGLVKQAFSQRRKTLRNTLHGLCGEAELRACGIDPSARAETLAVDDFRRLTRHLSASGIGSGPA